MPTPTPQRLVMRKVKDCKHSVVFEASDKDAIIDRVYLRRPFSDHLGTIEILVTPVVKTESVESV